ncbi:MAG: hypothetical protein JO097_00795 [Acidobacteriaceae bacterium]|nr:hypothetical protein [Acidobacteriaceae bacterium]
MLVLFRKFEPILATARPGRGPLGEEFVVLLDLSALRLQGFEFIQVLRQRYPAATTEAAGPQGPTI